MLIGAIPASATTQFAIDRACLGPDKSKEKNNEYLHLRFAGL